MAVFEPKKYVDLILFLCLCLTNSNVHRIRMNEFITIKVHIFRIIQIQKYLSISRLKNATRLKYRLESTDLVFLFSFVMLLWKVRSGKL